MNSRAFAIEVVQQLQQAGYQALWAGGCVRDQLLGLTPKDYDVATAATPDQVRDVFGHKRTLAIGASFGVITVLGPRSAAPIEVATFRRDGGYSDGRRPDAVEYTDAKEDALRRDFTINGMFYDPAADQVIDFVGGQEDLAAKQIRAIGVADQRIEEDKLRMLRGVRFAAKHRFEIEDSTLQAIQRRATEISVVSKERVGAEMQRMLADPNRATAVKLLRQAKLLAEVIPEGQTLYASEDQWEQTLAQLEALQTTDCCAAATILLKPILESAGVDVIMRCWKLSNDQRNAIDFACKQQSVLSGSPDKPWSKVQPLLLSPHVETTIAVVEACGGGECAKFLRDRLSWRKEDLNPEPLLNGQDLIQAGISPGPAFKAMLAECRAKQLDGELKTKEEALALVLKKFND